MENKGNFLLLLFTDSLGVFNSLIPDGMLWAFRIYVLNASVVQTHQSVTAVFKSRLSFSLSSERKTPL